MDNILQKRKQDIKKIIDGLDITPSMFKNAEEKYKNIAKYLNEHGLNVDISLQGSFAIGTATKPYSNGKDKAYDIDVICQFENENLTSEEIRNSLISTLNDSEVYSDKIKEWPKCFTLEYAKIGDYEFSIDLVPTISDENPNICGKNISEKYLINVLKIATKESKYGWYTINPKGYQTWFNDINSRFALYNRENRMRSLYEANKQIYASVEDIPEYFNKSSLQEAIQILKRSRDIYFSKIHKEDNKPASIIITTFVALIANNSSTDIDSIDLVFNVLKELNHYSSDELYSKIVSPIIKKDGRWEFLNPVNDKDNLLDSWNKDKENATLFFNWVKKTNKDFSDIIDLNNNEHIGILGNSLGNEIVDKLFERNKIEKISDGVKPYHD